MSSSGVHSSNGPIYVTSIKIPVTSRKLLNNIIKPRVSGVYENRKQAGLFNRNGHTNTIRSGKMSERVRHKTRQTSEEHYYSLFTFELSQLHICRRNDLRNFRHKRAI